MLAQPLEGNLEGLALSILDYRVLGSLFDSAPSMTFLNQLFKKVLDTSSEGLIIVDNRGCLVFLNSVAADHLGVSLRDILGMPLNYLREAKLADLSVAYEVLAHKRRISASSTFPNTSREVFLTGYPVFAQDASVSMVIITEKDLGGIVRQDTSDTWEKSVLSSIEEELSNLTVKDDQIPEFYLKSFDMKEAIEKARRYVRFQFKDILLLGEDGTEKVLVALFMHLSSMRAKETFYRINCAFTDEQSLEAELFGVEAGAYGEHNPSHSISGVLDLVGRGTLYLQNICNMPLSFQLRLQTFLAKREYRRVGGSAVYESFATIIFSSSKDLDVMVERKEFLPELYQKLSTHSIVIPPLRIRRDDMLDMARDELASLNKRYGTNKFLDPLAEEILSNYSFPGNIRELKNSIHQAVLFSGTSNIGSFLKLYFGPGVEMPVFDLRRAFVKSASVPDEIETLPMKSHLGKGLTATLNEIEKKLLMEALATCRSTREMAVVLGISQAGVSRKLKKYNLEAPGKIFQGL
ncbi:MAG: sigma 54-interacting transcriptional regulator [Deltaproteobacteria bacterium]|nr:sigma 54-interacting transcriptional regulator [Deltaproteobacteria bacterium]